MEISKILNGEDIVKVIKSHIPLVWARKQGGRRQNCKEKCKCQDLCCQEKRKTKAPIFSPGGKVKDRIAWWRHRGGGQGSSRAIA